MPPHAVVAVLRPVLGGLGAAHSAGLVHRDIKPENVLISDDGEVKLVDFGLVRAIAEAGITSTSVILGTAAYLSPEQVVGGETGPPSDVYSVGIMAFELLTGTAPFSGDSALAVANQRLDRDVPPPSSVIDGVPPQFDALIARATARNIDDRFGDATAMGAELDVIAEELALPQFRVPAPRNSAQHAAATVVHSRQPDRGPVAGPPVRTPTRQLTRDPQQWQPAAPGDTGVDDHEAIAEYPSPPRQFAGIAIEEFGRSRQRSRRLLAFWVLTVLVLTGGVAIAGWSLGTNLDGLLGR
jgi:serine/threonine-protein kinase